jgi:hypothetical protein
MQRAGDDGYNGNDSDGYKGADGLIHFFSFA